MEEFRKLYEEVYPDLYRMAYYYLGSAADAEDAVQDTALAAWKHFGGLKRKESFRAWIFQILVNICRKTLRGRGRQSSVSAAPAEERQPASAPETNLAERLEILELLSILEEEERVIVLLSVFGGYKGAEIAGLLNRRHSTIRSRYRRARKKLERELQEREFREKSRIQKEESR